MPKISKKRMIEIVRNSGEKAWTTSAVIFLIEQIEDCDGSTSPQSSKERPLTPTEIQQPKPEQK
jgi:hypothetical protein